MATPALSAPAFVQQFLDANGQPLAGGLIDVYFAGTTTRATVYQDAALSVAHPNPVVLDAAGRVAMFLPTGSYKFVLRRSTGEIVWGPIDNVASVDQLLSTIASFLEFEGQITTPARAGASAARLYYDGTLAALRLSHAALPYGAFASPLVVPLGGDPAALLTQATYAPLPDGVVGAVDGRLLGSRLAELHFLAYVDGGTGRVRLVNVTTGAAVPGSESTVIAISPAFHRVQDFALDTTQIAEYRVEAQKGTTWIRVWGAVLLVE